MMKIGLETRELMKKAVKFHGHTCPGVAIGVLVAKYILDHGNDFSIDEELVAVVENDNCSVDGIQALLGTTFGKGNLIHLDYGKNNFTFYNRTNEKAVKLSLKPSSLVDRELSREKRIEKLLSSNPEDFFKIEKVPFNPPQMAQIHDSIVCDRCGDPTMSTRIREYNNKKLCIPCFEIMNK
ncbi:MAG: formylmethanofuran dehydrogenase [Promethearchaeota archaeon]|nr:MAG: formylmethanofuran dehydrogenase [Candidatus Lokiarchaeota archaeon]